jgi:hypothetical protein
VLQCQLCSTSSALRHFMAGMGVEWAMNRTWSCRRSWQRVLMAEGPDGVLELGDGVATQLVVILGELGVLLLALVQLRL